MSDSEFLTMFKGHLTKAVISIVVTFIGSLIITVFTVRSQAKDISDLEEEKADIVFVEGEVKNITHQLDDIQQDIRSGQQLLIDLLREQ